MPKRQITTVNNIECYSCSNCDKIKPFDEFYNHGLYKDGTFKKKSNCKECVKKIRNTEENNKKSRERSKADWNNIKNNKTKLEDFREKNKIACKKYRKNNPKKRSETCRRYAKERRNNDVKYRILCNCRRRLHKAIKNTNKSATTQTLIGCTNKKLCNHLESQFTDGMNWDNYGEWVMDHIIPCVAFNLSRPKEQQRCFNYRNLQPMWGSENSSKGSEYKFNIVKEIELLNL